MLVLVAMFFRMNLIIHLKVESPTYFYQAFEELFEQYQSEGKTKSFKAKVCELINIIDRAILNRTAQENSTVHLVYFPR